MSFSLFLILFLPGLSVLNKNSKNLVSVGVSRLLSSIFQAIKQDELDALSSPLSFYRD